MKYAYKINNYDEGPRVYSTRGGARVRGAEQERASECPRERGCEVISLALGINSDVRETDSFLCGQQETARAGVRPL